MGGYFFLVGIIGLVLYVLLRVFEVRRGARFSEQVRVQSDRLSTRLYRLAVFGELPSSYRSWFLKEFRTFTHRVVVFLVATLRAIERPLSRLNHRLRAPYVKKTPPADTSPFLKTMSDTTKHHGEKPPSSV